MYASMAKRRTVANNAEEARYANIIGIVVSADYAREFRFAAMAFRSQSVPCAHTGCSLREIVNYVNVQR